MQVHCSIVCRPFVHWEVLNSCIEQCLCEFLIHLCSLINLQDEGKFAHRIRSLETMLTCVRTQPTDPLTGRIGTTTGSTCTQQVIVSRGSISPTRPPLLILPNCLCRRSFHQQRSAVSFDRSLGSWSVGLSLRRFSTSLP